MSEKLDCDVLIAGAGPTGMSAAIALTQAGYRVDLIDKHKDRLSFSRAILVNSHTLKLLNPYGVSEKIVRCGRPFKSITIYGPSQTLIEGEFQRSDMDYIQPTALPQLETESCFTERLQEKGVAIKRPQELKAFIDKREYVESFISTSNGDQRVISRYLLGADGFHSIVRQGLSIKYDQSASPIQMYSQDSVIDWSSKSDLTIWILDSGAAIAMKIGHNMVRFAATNFETFQALGVTDKIEKTTCESYFDVYFAQVDSYAVEMYGLLAMPPMSIRPLAVEV
ncbi:MAG: FAD-dependent oxidoreductase [Methylocystis sp.]